MGGLGTRGIREKGNGASSLHELRACVARIAPATSSSERPALPRGVRHKLQEMAPAIVEDVVKMGNMQPPFAPLDSRGVVAIPFFAAAAARVSGSASAADGLVGC